MDVVEQGISVTHSMIGKSFILLVLVAIAVPILILKDTRVIVILMVAVISLVLYTRDNMFFYYAAVPTLIIFGNLGIKASFPFVGSPFALLVTFGIGLGVIRTAVTKPPLQRSGLYFPMLFFLSIAIAQVALIKEGDGIHVNALEKLIRGLWPFAMIVLALQTPRQARNVLLVLGGTTLLAFVLWLPGMLYAAFSGDTELLRSATPALTGNPLIDMAFTFGLRTYLFVVPFSTLAGITVAFAIYDARYRFWALLALCLIAIYTLSTSIASSFISLIVSVITTVFFALWLPASRENLLSRWKYFVRVLLLVLVFGGIGALIIISSPVASAMVERVLNPSDDQSGSSRLYLLNEAFQVVAKNPLFGAYGDVSWYGGHDSLMTYSANWGLVFTVPYLLTLVMVILNCLSIAKRTPRLAERALLIGMASTIAANIVVSIVTPNLVELFADMVVWTFAALTVIWTNWLNRNPNQPLIA